MFRQRDPLRRDHVEYRISGVICQGTTAGWSDPYGIDFTVSRAKSTPGDMGLDQPVLGPSDGNQMGMRAGACVELGLLDPTMDFTGREVDDLSYLSLGLALG